MELNLNGRLEPISSEDLHTVLQWRNKEQIRKNMYNEDLITFEQHIKWFQGLQQNPGKKTYVFYFKDVPLGVVNFTIDFSNRKCEWGFYIGEDNIPKGTGSLMGYTAMNFAFQQLNLRKITGEVFDFNKKSQAYHENLGFQREGILVSHIRKGTDYHDIHIYSLLKYQWDKQKIETEEFLKNVLKDGNNSNEGN
jgi:UDP-4-amino-4,6-dideoxy-N-acetyl-beta-L-altrosamine N-acetyltransferase